MPEGEKSGKAPIKVAGRCGARCRGDKRERQGQRKIIECAVVIKEVRLLIGRRSKVQGSACKD